MRLDGMPVVCRPHHAHWMWVHGGYYRESQCAYGRVYVGGVFQGAYVSTRGWAKANFHSPLVPKECVGLDRRWRYR